MKEINENTKIATRPAQFLAITAAIFVFGGVYASMNGRLTIVENRLLEQETQSKQIQFIRESVIRIEGKLDTKQDKFLNTK